MKGVKFDEIHSYNDFSLILSSVEIGTATPKIDLLEVPGASQPLDFTEFFGDIQYENRPLSFTFSAKVRNADFPDLFSRVQNALNGRRMKITLDNDPVFYYSGRLSVKEWKQNKAVGELTVDADCDPYKLKHHHTVIVEAISGEKDITLHNLRKHVVPVFETDAEMLFQYEGNSYTVNAGTFRLPEIVLKEGENVLSVTGTGTIKIEYQEGGL